MRFTDLPRLGLVCIAASVIAVTALGVTACNPVSSSKAAQSTTQAATAQATATQATATQPPATQPTATQQAAVSASPSTAVSAATSTSPSALTAPPADCSSSGTTIPAGTYSGPIKATLTTQMHLNLAQTSVPDAGGGTEAFNGDVMVVSDGKQVTGTITLSGLGLSQVGMASAPNVHSVDNGGLTATISGSASSPVVEGTLTGEWASLDAPVINATGSATSPIHAGLHITRAGCDSISGDAIAMFAEFASSVSQYLSFGGSGVWTATRTG